MFLFFSLTTVNAKEFKTIDYNNIKDGAKIFYDGLNWTSKVKRKSSDYYQKRIANGATKYSEFYSPENVFLFSTATNYDFIYKGSLIGYSNLDMKFYEYSMDKGILEQRELTSDEVQDLFPKYKIVKISDFSTSTNCIKIKKNRSDLKLIVLNDTDRSFDNYAFFTNNSKIELYNLKGFLDIKKRGLIQLSRFGANSKDFPWFIILVR